MQKKINVVLISSFAPPQGGLATWSSEYLEACKKRSLNVYCVNTNYVGKKSIIHGKRNLIYEIKRSVRIWKELKKACKSAPMDVVHLCSPCSLYGNLRDIITLKIAKKTARNAKIILHCHCDLTYFVGESKLKRFVFSKLIGCTDKIFVMNNQSQKYAEVFQPENTIEYIPNFLAYIPIEEEKTRDNTFRVLFLGRQTKLKGIDIFIAVAKKAYDEFGDKMIFDIVGDSLPEAMPIEYPPNVFLHGPQPHFEALRFMSKADALLFPSRTEGFPYVILEAMMYKTAVIASDVGAIPDMLESTDAFVIKEWNEEDYYNALKQIYYGNSSKAIGEKEYSKYEGKYTPRVVMQKIISQYIR